MKTNKIKPEYKIWLSTEAGDLNNGRWEMANDQAIEKTGSLMAATNYLD